MAQAILAHRLFAQHVLRRLEQTFCALAMARHSNATTAADYEKVNAALGKVIASVPSSQVMDVFNAFSKITGPQVPSNLFNMVSPSEATAAYDAFLKFKDVVKAAQR